MAKLLMVALSIFLARVECYPTGAPVEVCDSMAPGHGTTEQTTEFPYQVTLSNSVVNPGEAIEITISGADFKGFFIQVRDGDKAVGSFDLEGSKEAHNVPCHGSATSTATQSDVDVKNSITLKWIAPEKEGQYKIYLTMVADYKTFWTKRPVGKINVGGDLSHPINKRGCLN